MAKDSKQRQHTNNLSTKNYSLKTRQYFIEQQISTKEFLNEVCKNANFDCVVDQYQLDQVSMHELLAEDEAFKNSIDAAENIAKNIALSQLYKRGVHGYVDIKEDGEGNVIERTRKQSDRCLLEYIKATVNKPRHYSKEESSITPPIMQDGDSMAIARFNSQPKGVNNG